MLSSLSSSELLSFSICVCVCVRAHISFLEKGEYSPPQFWKSLGLVFLTFTLLGIFQPLECPPFIFCKCAFYIYTHQ